MFTIVPIRLFWPPIYITLIYESFQWVMIALGTKTKYLIYSSQAISCLSIQSTPLSSPAVFLSYHPVFHRLLLIGVLFLAKSLILPWDFRSQLAL